MIVPFREPTDSVTFSTRDTHLLVRTRVILTAHLIHNLSLVFSLYLFFIICKVESSIHTNKEG